MKRILLLGVATALALALGWGLFGGATRAGLADGAHDAAPLPPNLTPTPTPTPGCGWNIVNSPNNILAYNYLQAMAGLGSTDVWAVGYSEDLLAGMNQTVVMRWRGAGWTLVPSLNSGSRSRLYGVAPVTATDVWTVGSTWNGQAWQPYILHWTGSGWIAVPGPSVGAGDSELYAAAARGPNDVWAVGYTVTSGAYHTLIAHWDGTVWTLVASPNGGASDNFLYGVTALAANDAWAVGSYWTGSALQAVTLHWDGTAWTAVPGPTAGSGGTELRAVAALAPNDIWAVGVAGINTTGFRGLIAHWDGSAWTTVSSPQPGSISELYGVAASSPTDIWATGYQYELSLGAPRTLIEHWDGATWTLSPSPNMGSDTNILRGVAAFGPADAWVAGYYVGNMQYQNTLIERYSSVCPTATPAPATATPTPAPPSATRTATPTATVCVIQFADVDQQQPFYPYIRCLACRQIVSGYSDGTFRPANNVTRGQLAKILAGAAGLAAPVPTTRQTFADVPAGQPFWLWIERLAGQGAITGYACGGPGEPCDPTQRPYFRPGADATRGQIAKIAALVAGLADPVPTGQQTFADVPPSQPFWLWIEQLAGRGVISGYTCGGPGEPCDPTQRPYFRWGNATTRGQMSKIAANTFFPACQTPAKR